MTQTGRFVILLPHRSHRFAATRRQLLGRLILLCALASLLLLIGT